MTSQKKQQQRTEGNQFFKKDGSGMKSQNIGQDSVTCLHVKDIRNYFQGKIRTFWTRRWVV